MINLLPRHEKRQLQAARTNTLLVRYNTALLGAIVFLGLAMMIVYFYLGAARTTAEQTINENRARASQYASVAAQAEAFRSNLATAKQILGNEITYSNILLTIAGLMPSGTILQNLTLDAQTFGTSTALVAETKSYDGALALKDSLQKSSLFSDVHFQSVASSDNQTGYPYTVTLAVTFKKGSAK